jgi:hypothetical protein
MFIAVLPWVSHLISNILKYRRKVTNRGKTDVLSKPLKRRIRMGYPRLKSPTCPCIRLVLSVRNPRSLYLSLKITRGPLCPISCTRCYKKIDVALETASQKPIFFDKNVIISEVTEKNM